MCSISWFFTLQDIISNAVCLNATTTVSLAFMSSPLPDLTPNRLWERREDQRWVSAPFNNPQETACLLVLLILLGSIIFNDNSSSRIGFKFYKYISKLIFATFWVLFHFKMHCSSLPRLGALDVEFHTHVFQPVFYIFNKTDMLPSTTPCRLPIAFHRLTKDTYNLGMWPAFF